MVKGSIRLSYQITYNTAGALLRSPPQAGTPILSYWVLFAKLTGAPFFIWQNMPLPRYYTPLSMTARCSQWLTDSRYNQIPTSRLKTSVAPFTFNSNSWDHSEARLQLKLVPPNNLFFSLFAHLLPSLPYTCPPSSKIPDSLPVPIPLIITKLHKQLSQHPPIKSFLSLSSTLVALNKNACFKSQSCSNLWKSISLTLVENARKIISCIYIKCSIFFLYAISCSSSGEKFWLLFFIGVENRKKGHVFHTVRFHSS